MILVRLELTAMPKNGPQILTKTDLETSFNQCLDTQFRAKCKMSQTEKKP